MFCRDSGGIEKKGRMKTKGCPPKELMDVLADYYFDEVEGRDSAYEYPVPNWVMERAERYEVGKVSWYWWMMRKHYDKPE